MKDHLQGGHFEALKLASTKSERVFVSRERVSGFPEKGADVRGSRGNFPGTSGLLPGKSGELPGNLWIAVKFLVRQNYLLSTVDLGSQSSILLSGGGGR